VNFSKLLAVHQSYKTKAVISPLLDITVKVQQEMVKKTVDARVAPECVGYVCCYGMYLQSVYQAFLFLFQ